MLSREQCREIDRYAIDELGIPGIVLMENAGRGCSEVLLQTLAVQSHSNPSSKERIGVVICCGPGNNGGDGFVIARHLHLAGLTVKVLLFAPIDRYRGDAQTNLQIIERMQLPIVSCDFASNWEVLIENMQAVEDEPTQWVIDALLGTGAAGNLSPQVKSAVEAMNRVSARRLAVDIPTGLDCDTGRVADIAVESDITCTFVDHKLGFNHPSALQYLGKVATIGIGAPWSSKDDRQGR
jgi:NAD(P)H-hydrate epimerase